MKYSKTKLNQEVCIPCQVGAPIVDPREVKAFLKDLNANWDMNAQQHLCLELSFPDFCSALQFTNALGELAEQEQHHPDLQLGWGYVRIELWTHKAHGVTQSDLVMAAKIDTLAQINNLKS